VVAQGHAKHPMMVIYSDNQGGVTPETNWRPMYVSDENQRLPNWVEHGNLSHSLLKQGKHAEAAYISERIVEQNPESVEALCMKVESMLRVKRFGEVPAIVEAALELMGEPPVIPEERVEAEEPFNKMYAQLQFLMGKAKLSLGKREDGEACFLVATQRDPQHAEAFCGLGMAMYDRGQRCILRDRPALDQAKVALKAKKKEVQGLKDSDKPPPAEEIEELDMLLETMQENIDGLIAALAEHQETKTEGGRYNQKSVELKGRNIRL